MSELVDFMLEREKRLIGGLSETVPLSDMAIICNCGSAKFYLLRDASAECIKCKEKQPDIRWILTGF